jgi:hypothetical protein
MLNQLGAAVAAYINEAAFRIEIEKCDKCGGRVKEIAGFRSLKKVTAK